jgi:small-conductance mechanosensitive channel
MQAFFDSLVQSEAGFGPPWMTVMAAAALVLIVLIGLHALLIRRLARLLEKRRPFVSSLLRRTRYLFRLVLVVAVMAAAVPVAELPAGLVGTIHHILILSSIFLSGWAVMIVCDVGADLYLRRFRVDVEDNLLARKMVTQVRILKRTVKTLIVVVVLALMLMTFDGARELGVSLMASAGAAGLVLGFAARPVLSNLIAGIQIAITQPIRVDDAVVVEGEWGWIEEITGTYVVIKIWDWRRLVIPLSYFMEKPFQNWTRTSASIIGTVFLHVDYTVPVQRIRDKLTEFAQESELWDGQVVNLQVTEALETTMQLRILVSATNSPRAWDLRCEIREKMVDFLQREFPDALPRHRVLLEEDKAPEGTPREDAPRGRPIP